VGSICNRDVKGRSQSDQSPVLGRAVAYVLHGGYNWRSPPMTWSVTWRCRFRPPSRGDRPDARSKSMSDPARANRFRPVSVAPVARRTGVGPEQRDHDLPDHM